MSLIKLHEHVPTDKLTKLKYDIAEALNTICYLRHPDKLNELSETERYELFNKSMMKVCNILDIDLDMHELLKSGSEGFSYSDNNESTEALENILGTEINDNQSENTLKAQLQDLHALNHSMFKEDIHEVPRFTDGTEITAKDLADMNINALDNIAELIGFELEE